MYDPLSRSTINKHVAYPALKTLKHYFYIDFDDLRFLTCIHAAWKNAKIARQSPLKSHESYIVRTRCLAMTPLCVLWREIFEVEND